MKLRREDLFTGTWRRLKATVEDRLEELRSQLECLDLTEQQTSAKRGAIAELRTLLADAEASAGQAEVPVTDGNFTQDRADPFDD